MLEACTVLFLYVRNCFVAQAIHCIILCMYHINIVAVAHALTLVGTG